MIQFNEGLDYSFLAKYKPQFQSIILLKCSYILLDNIKLINVYLILGNLSLFFIDVCCFSVTKSKTTLKQTNNTLSLSLQKIRML